MPFLPSLDPSHPRRIAAAFGLLLASGIAAVPFAANAQAPVEREVTIAGDSGTLAGAQIDPGKSASLVLLIPGSGPTDRDGNNPLGVAGGPYRQLARALAARGVATLRIDKRGMFGSKGAGDPNQATITGYAQDVRAWIADARRRSGRRCVWVAGHSEGGLVALVTAQQPEGICGLVLIATPGRPLGAIMREQFRANPANLPILAPALALLDTLEAGRRADVAALPAPLPQIFLPAIQDFLIDAMRHDPAALAARVTVPVLVAQGDRDIQVRVLDSDRLQAALRRSSRSIVPGMTHVLRLAQGETPAASMATYADASLPVAPALIEAIAGFVKR